MEFTLISNDIPAAIVSLAQKRVKAIREARTSMDFLDGMKGMDAIIAFEETLDELVTAVPDLAAESASTHTTAELMQTDWIG